MRSISTFPVDRLMAGSRGHQGAFPSVLMDEHPTRLSPQIVACLEEHIDLFDWLVMMCNYRSKGEVSR